MEVGRARVTEFHGLERAVARLPWHAYAPRGGGGGVRVRAVCLRSTLYHETAVAERVRDAISGRLRGLSRSGKAVPGRGGTPTGGGEVAGVAPLDVLVRLTGDDASFLVDAAGAAAPMHQRGWRGAATSTCMRESTAAACVARVAARIDADAAAGGCGGGDGEAWWQRGVWDAFCGSGTLLLEAADAAGARPPGLPLPRTFAFQQWPTHEERAYAAYVRAATQVRMPCATLRGRAHAGGCFSVLWVC